MGTELQAAVADVVDDRVAGDYIIRVADWDVSRLNADNNCKLGLEIELIGHLRVRLDLVAGADNRRGRLVKEVRLRADTDLASVRGIVDGMAYNFCAGHVRRREPALLNWRASANHIDTVEQRAHYLSSCVSRTQEGA